MICDDCVINFNTDQFVGHCPFYAHIFSFLVIISKHKRRQCNEKFYYHCKLTAISELLYNLLYRSAYVVTKPHFFTVLFNVFRI